MEAAFKLAVEQSQNILKGYKIEFATADTKCNPKLGMQGVLTLQRKLRGLDGIIGSTCSIVCEPVGLLAAAWNIPQVSYYCASSALADKNRYPTFSRTRINNFLLSDVTVQILSHFGWKDISIVSSEISLHKLAAEYLAKIAHDMDINSRIFTVSSTVPGNKIDADNLDIMRKIIREIKIVSKVIIMYLYQVDFRHFLILAKQEGLHDGSHVFIGHAKFCI